MVGRGGTVSLNRLPPGDFPVSIFDTVIDGITIRGSIGGTRLDLQEALSFASEGKEKATIATETLDKVNDIFARTLASILPSWFAGTSHGEFEFSVVNACLMATAGRHL